MDRVKAFITAHRAKLEAQGYKPGQTIVYQDSRGMAVKPITKKACVIKVGPPPEWLEREAKR